MELEKIIPEQYLEACLYGDEIKISSPFKKMRARSEFIKKTVKLCKDFAQIQEFQLEYDLLLLEKDLFKPKNYDKEAMQYDIAVIDTEQIVGELNGTFFRSIYKEYRIVDYILSSKCLVNLDKKLISEIYKRFRIIRDIDEQFIIICNSKNLIPYLDKIHADGDNFVKAVDRYYNAIA